jgi:hypothetical protein
VTGMHGLTQEQAHWLQALLETRPRRHTALVSQFRMPEEVHCALAEKGLVRSIRGTLEITLEGIREIARRPLTDETG